MGNRPYQVEQLSCTKKDYEAGTRRLLINAATGTGKTVYLSQLPKYMGLGGQTVVLVHREELATQAQDKIQKWNPDLKVDVEMGDRFADPSADVIVASVATIGKEGSTRLQRFNKDNVKLVITDEAHHSTASTYVGIYEYFNMLADAPGKLLVGVTATPGRGDGEPLAKVYQKITHSYPLRQAIEDGYLCDLRAIKLKTGTDITSVGSARGDFKVGELSDAIDNPKRNQKIVKAWLDNAKGRPTIAFTADIAHAVHLAEMFERYGVKAAAIWGDDPERSAKLELHRRGQLEVLCNCGVLTEGYDDWRVSCVIMARPTKSQTLYVQCIGRGTRLQEGVSNLKTALAENWSITKIDCLVIDCVDATAKNSLTTLPSIFGMNSEFDLKGDSVLGAVRILEQVQAENPHVDLATLDSLDKVDAAVEDARIWDVKLPPEVEANSRLSWNRAFDGSYILQLPETDAEREKRQSEEKAGKKKPSWLKDPTEKMGDHVRIKQTVLGKWEIYGRIQKVTYRGERDTIEEAFRGGDKLVIEKASHALKLLRAEADWHGDPITGPQKRLLGRLMKGEPIPPGLTKGQANKLISRLTSAKFTSKLKVKK